MPGAKFCCTYSYAVLINYPERAKLLESVVLVAREALQRGHRVSDELCLFESNSRLTKVWYDLSQP